MEEIRLMKGNEAIAEATIRAGADAYFGYPITPQTEIMEYLAAEMPEERTGMIVLQAESEIGAINMVLGAAGTGKKVMISSSSPGVSLIQEGLSYLAGSEIPCLVVDIVRGGPGLGTIQASQADYFQATRGGGHGDYRTYVLAPNSVQEMADFVKIGFDIAFKYRNPVIILADAIIGMMMEKVKFSPQEKRLSNEQIEKLYPWAATGKNSDRKRNVLKSVELNSELQEQNNLKLLSKYEQMEREEIRYESIQCDDAEYVIVAYGSTSRICLKVVENARKEGLKIGLLRPISLYPFPYKPLALLADKVKGFMAVEMSAGQMVEDVRLSVNGRKPVEYFGRLGGIIPTPVEILSAIKSKLIRA